ncbi:hypothetical protein [Nocardioides marmoribigeumensis]|uniref:Very-short-patch-repair endonuclease n=1 Tax=Nocardioides marmoribigeumensis TaxID=433649 RepID=A0ABU2BTL7_9ACTN|nr:hypothetical protein [Nocardioides marmoribigeumensis]MDR7361973.1 very-short-patch-repair endonuclease [Nocardioides marmoribigeumensis]
MTTIAQRGRLRGREWHRVSTGLFHSDRGRPLDAWQLALPRSGRFSHLTAAELWGWWLPHLPDRLPVIAAVDAKATRPQRPGLRVVRVDPWRPSTELDGLRVDSAVDTLLVCARDLSLLDLVVLVDSALHAGACTRSDLERAAATRRKGARALREALALADERSESAYETLLRLLHTIAGYDVEPQKVIRDGAGDEIARADLWFVGTMHLAEYDGKDHLPREQQEVDLARGRRIVAQGWIRRGYVSKDLVHKAAGVLRDAELVTGRAARSGALAEWNQLLAGSCYTPAGRALLARRVGNGGSGKCSADPDKAVG